MPAWAVRSPVAHLATVGAAHPHVVPVVFCEVAGSIYVPVDGKPKSGRRLQRLANIERNPAVSLLVDVYADDWSKLRWLRVDGEARLTATTETVAEALRAKYPQYARTALGTEAIRIAVQKVRTLARGRQNGRRRPVRDRRMAAWLVANRGRRPPVGDLAFRIGRIVPPARGGRLLGFAPTSPP